MRVNSLLWRVINYLYLFEIKRVFRRESKFSINAMKQILFAIFILLLSIVKAQVDLPETEINTWREPHLGPYIQPPDTVNIDLKQLSKNDTLIITGEYRECGEFGGHYEHIYIAKQRNNLKCWLIIDPSCIPVLSKIPSRVPGLEFEKNPFADTISLHKKEKKLILEYFQEFGILAVTSYGYSNASTKFSIELNKTVLYSRKDLLGKWSGFTNLKEKIFLNK